MDRYCTKYCNGQKMPRRSRVSLLYFLFILNHFGSFVLTLWSPHVQVSMDSGALGLDKVCELITQGENLPVHFEKELKVIKQMSLFSPHPVPTHFFDMLFDWRGGAVIKSSKSPLLHLPKAL